MSWNWASEATIAAVALAWVGVWWLRRQQLNFTVVALVALTLGIPIGLIAGRQHVQAINPIGVIYINVLLATVAPLIFVAIVSSITSLGSLAKLRSIGARSVYWLVLSNALGVVVALGLGLAFEPGHGVHAKLGAVSTAAVQGQVQTFSQVVVGLFPTNVVENFSANDIVPIIMIAVTLSIAYLALAQKEGEKIQPFRSGAEALKLVIFKAVGYVIRLTPYAIVALTAYTVGDSTNLGKSFWSLAGLLALVWAACLLHSYFISGVIVKVFADLPVIAFFRKIFPAQLTAFTTQSSVGTLPVTTARLTRDVGVHPEIAHFTAPLGTTIGMPGCSGIWPMLIAIWGINAYDIHYTVGNYVVLAALSVVVSIGTAGVPGAATVAAATVLTAAKLPLEFVSVTIPIGMLADMARTATNVTAAAVSSAVVARQTGLLNDAIFAGQVQFIDEDELAESEAVASPRTVANIAGEVRLGSGTRQPTVPVSVSPVPSGAAIPNFAAAAVAEPSSWEPANRPGGLTTQQIELASAGWGTNVMLTITATPMVANDPKPSASPIVSAAPHNVAGESNSDDIRPPNRSSAPRRATVKRNGGASLGSVGGLLRVLPGAQILSRRGAKGARS